MINETEVDRLIRELNSELYYKNQIKKNIKLTSDPIEIMRDMIEMILVDRNIEHLRHELDQYYIHGVSSDKINIDIQK